MRLAERFPLNAEIDRRFLFRPRGAGEVVIAVAEASAFRGQISQAATYTLTTTHSGSRRKIPGALCDTIEHLDFIVLLTQSSTSVRFLSRLRPLWIAVIPG